MPRPGARRPAEPAAVGDDRVAATPQPRRPADAETPVGGSGRNERLVSAGLIMAAGTAVSRVLGFGRVVMISIVLGIGTRQADMFTIANTVPNSIYILLAGGALNTVFVPQIVRAIKKDEDHGVAYTNRIVTATLLILMGITVAVTALAPVIIWIYSDGAWHQPDLHSQFHSMVMLAYLCLPQVFFYGAYTVVGQVLNARGVFGPMMWAPIVNNVISIGVLGLYLGLWGNGGDGTHAFTFGQELVLGVGATVGIAAQAAILIPFMHRAGFRYRPRFDLRGTGLGHTFRLARWILGFVLATQLSVVVITRLASSATVDGTGAGWTAYNNAYLLWILPHSLVTVSLVTAMLPHASALAADDDLTGVRREAVRTLRLAMSVVLPVAAAFVALGGPLAAIVLGYGRGAGSTGPVAWTLVAFALGLGPFTVQYVIQRTYYAMEDTRTPFLQQCLIVVVNIVGAIVLTVPFHKPDWVAPGLALSYSLAYTVGMIVSFRQLAERLPGLSAAELLRHGVRVVVAVIPAAGAAWAITWAFASWSHSQPVRLLSLVAAALVAVPLFLAVAKALRIGEVDEILAPMWRRLPGRRRAVVRQDADPAGTGADAGHEPAPSPIVFAEASATDSALLDTVSASDQPSISDRAVTMKLDAQGHLADPGSGDPDEERAADHPTAGDPSAADPAADDPATEEQHTADSPDGQATELMAAQDTPAEPEYDGQPREPIDADAPADHPVLSTGKVLGERYRLEEVMAQRHNIATWRAFDEVLSRSVVCHVLRPGDPRTERVMDAARRSAIATDSRFLRVLDAVQNDPLPERPHHDHPDHDHPDHPDHPDHGDRRPDDDRREHDEVGAYVVCEYVPGQSLETLLAGGPLTALEAAWLVREVADALAGVHSGGLFHQRINPDTVVITPSGNIKIVGLLLEAALSTQPGLPEGAERNDPATLRRGRTPGHPDTAASDDVADLGRLVYACLVQRWPGGDHWGLQAAPTDGHAFDDGRGWLSPRQVRAGVSPALDRICDQILLPRARDPIRTAHGVVNALTKVLGTADASADLERRLRQPVPVVHEPGVDPHLTQAPSSPETAFWAQQQSPATPPRPVAAAPSGADPVTTPAPAARPPRGHWVAVLVVLVVVAMVAAFALAWWASHRTDSTAGAETSASATAAPAGPLTIATVHDFDPKADNGSGDENPGEVKYAYDGDPKTEWRTLQYRGNPELGGLKPGVGLVVDLGSPQQVGTVEVAVRGSGSTLELRVPTQADASSAPMHSQSQWRVVATATNASGTVKLAPADGTVTTRYLLLYFTKLAPDGHNYRGGIYQISVLR